MHNRIFASFAALALTAGCTENETPAKVSTQPAEQPAEQAEAAAGAKEEAGAEPANAVDAVDALKEAPDEVRSTLVAYEEIRRSLVDDEIGPAVKQASTLQKEAEAATKQVKEEKSQKALGSLAEAAAAFGKAPADDADAVRKAYGEVSRHLVALAQADPKVAKVLHVFECPMAQGYKRWAQLTEGIENPYMGQKMLECGSEVPLKS